MTSASGLSTVTCVAITKNEEHNLLDCRQFVHWVDEGAVIDAESSDRMADLARGGGAKAGYRRNACKLNQACLHTASLLEDIRPISLARIIHVDSSRKRADVKRDGHSEA
jgi:hypothetical protein